MIADSLEPKWVKGLDLDFYFEEQQTMVLQVYDVDDATQLHDLSKHDFIGEFKFPLSTVVSSANQEYSGQLTGGKRGGKVKVMATEKKQNYGKTLCTFTVDIDKKGMVHDPIFFTISKYRSPGKYQPVYKSECKKKLKGKFKFNRASIDTDTLCDDNPEQNIFI